MAAAGEAGGAQSQTRFRVKVYELDKDCQWLDRGCGHVALVNMQLHGGRTIVVRSEEDGTALLESKLQCDEDAYKRQHDTLIVWEEPDCDTELALSFQEKEGCEEVWAKMQDWISTEKAEGRKNKRTIDEKEEEEEEEEEEEGEGGESNGTKRKKRRKEEDEDEREVLTIIVNNSGPTKKFVNGIVEDPDEEKEDLLPLPEATPETLPELAQTIASTPMYLREKLANTIVAKEHMQKLIEIFHKAEKEQNQAELAPLFNIFKSLVLLQESSIIEVIVDKGLLLDVIGVLEYDPDIHERQKHREFIATRATYKEVIPVENEALKEKIHTTYRLQYMKDVILPRLIEDPTSNTLTSFIFFNNIEIVQALQQDKVFMIKLFDQLADDETSAEGRRDVLLFLKEFCGLAKSLQLGARMQFYKDLVHYGLLKAMPKTLTHTDVPIRMAAAEVLNQVLQQDPALVRDQILDERKPPGRNRGRGGSVSMGDRPKGPGLLKVLVQAFVAETETGMRTHLSEILRVLLDPDSMDTIARRSEFMNHFYEDCFQTLVEPIVQVPDVQAARDAYVDTKAPLLYFLVELLASYVKQHQHTIRTHLLRTVVIEKIAMLVSCRHKYLALGALRFLRAVLMEKEELYVRYLAKHQALEYVVMAYEANATRPNMLNSAVIDFCDTLRKDENKVLLKQLVELYGPRIRDTLPIYKTVMAQHEQNEDTASFTHEATESSSRFRRDARQMDADEEDWFEEDEDDDGPGSVPQRVIPPTRVGPVLLARPRILGPKKVTGNEANANGKANETKPSLMPLVPYGDDDDSDESDGENASAEKEESSGSDQEGKHSGGEGSDGGSSIKDGGEGSVSGGEQSEGITTS